MKTKKTKKSSNKSPKNPGKAIARFFKDLRGETKKIVWPGRKMVLKSTGIVLAAILVIGAGIWILDFAVSGAVKGFSNIAEQTTVEETTEEDEKDADEKDEETTEESTEKE